MSQDQTLKTIADVTLGTAAASAFAWLPATMHDVSSVAEFVTIISGCILVLIRTFFAMVAWRAYRISGKIPRDMREEVDERS